MNFSNNFMKFFIINLEFTNNDYENIILDHEDQFDDNENFDFE